MQKDSSGRLMFSPGDLVRFAASPFAAWMDRYYVENPSVVRPDEITEDQHLLALAGEEHERHVLGEFKASGAALIEVSRHDSVAARAQTHAAIQANTPVIYQAALDDGLFYGFTDFLLLEASGRYQVWDAKLARSLYPHYAIQLCCYSELLAAVAGPPISNTFGLILGAKDRVPLHREDFIHYYHHVKKNFLDMQKDFTGNFSNRPEPLPRADHGRWTSHAEAYFHDTDHLVQVAGITVGQIKKLKRAGIASVAGLAAASGQSVPKLAKDSLDKLAGQARLQCRTRTDRIDNPDAPPLYEILPSIGANGEPLGLAALPPDHPADVFF